MYIQKYCYFIILNKSFYVNIHVEASTDVIILLVKYFCPVSVHSYQGMKGSRTNLLDLN